MQWAIDALSSPDKKDNVVKAKQMEALKRLGHHELKLDEYERKFFFWCCYAYFFHLNIETLGKVANEVIHPDDIQVTFKGTFGPSYNYSAASSLSIPQTLEA